MSLRSTATVPHAIKAPAILLGCPPKAEVVSSNLAGSAKSSLFSLILLAYLDALPCGPNMGPNVCTALERRLVSVIHGTVHHCIMHRLSRLYPRMQAHS